MGRPKQPVELVIANGKKHLTKEEIKERKQTELKAPVGNVTPPTYLDPASKKEFKDLAAKLVKLEIMTELDVDLLARYLLSKQAYLTLTRKYNKAITDGHVNVLNTLSAHQDRAFKQCQSCARELGLTISSRCKLVVPKTEDPKENKFRKFEKGVG